MFRKNYVSYRGVYPVSPPWPPPPPPPPAPPALTNEKCNSTSAILAQLFMERTLFGKFFDLN